MKRNRIDKSTIINAGQGLFAAEQAKKDDFIARYSGDVLNLTQCEQSDSQYIVKIHNNLYLDAANPNRYKNGVIQHIYPTDILKIRSNRYMLPNRYVVQHIYFVLQQIYTP